MRGSAPRPTDRRTARHTSYSTHQHGAGGRVVENALALVQAVVDAQPAKSKTKGGKAKGTSKRFVERVQMGSTMGKSFTIRRMSLNLRKSAEDEE